MFVLHASTESLRLHHPDDEDDEAFPLLSIFFCDFLESMSDSSGHSYMEE